jgi:hypothetical protein
LPLVDIAFLAPEAEKIVVVLALAQGEMDETEFSAWLKVQSVDRLDGNNPKE